jgi:thiosulfate/3-mercaptopyruvate sulfurtransferase
MEFKVPENNKNLVSPQWLAARMGQADLAIVDASWYLPDHKRDAKAEYAAGHIEGAVFFDVDGIADQSSGLPHMLPTEIEFAQIVGAMGISETDTIVVYDGLGLFSAARVWWTFRVFGARKVYILDGGLPAWVAQGLPLTSNAPTPAKKSFVAKLDRTKMPLWPLPMRAPLHALQEQRRNHALVYAADICRAQVRCQARCWSKMAA